MTHFIAISDQNASKAFDLFQGETEEAAFLAAIASMGGEHHALVDGVYANVSGSGQHLVRDSARDNHSFWFAVMSDFFEGNDNREWFIGEDQADVERQALAYHEGEAA